MIWACGGVHSSNVFREGKTLESTPIMKSRNWMYIVDGGASQHIMRINSLTPLEKKSTRQTRNHFGIHKSNGSSFYNKRRSTSQSWVPTFTSSSWKILHQYCRWEDYVKNWDTLGRGYPEKIPH